LSAFSALLTGSLFKIEFINYVKYYCINTPLM
jgi:hypothetical protein